ncbi:MAG: adenylate/guanylate cyclase domain-containing protein [Gammaproteobacteria bacterium CG22_combo_CG10-13_8_21_14_all_40_8]|nr:MAG: adenylate/guanylate cyclase domain-containing protein [Gammaproteobacteria bacterium CG22_combo_CG10-13_8_21_14_all_40_8]
MHFNLFKRKLSVKHYRFMISLTVFLILAANTTGKVDLDFVNSFENFLYDVRLNLTLKNTKDTRIVIIDIDEKSIQKQGRWPWHRNKLAKLVNALFDDYQIKALGFDMVFAEEDDVSADLVLDKLLGDSQFQETVTQNILKTQKYQWQTDLRFSESLIARDVVLGYIFKNHLDHLQNATLNLLPNPIISSSQLNGIQLDAYRPVGYTSNLALLQENAKAAGFYDYPREEDVLRKVPILQLYEGALYESLALSLARIALGDQPIKLTFNALDNNRNGVNLASIDFGDKKIPVDSSLSVYIPYRGKQGSFEYISATDVLTGKVKESLLKDKIVLVGASAPGLLDLRATPFDESYIGVEVHANLISGILDQTFKQSPAYMLMIELLQLLVLSLFILWRIPRAKPSSILIVLSFVLVVTMSINYWVWQDANLIIPLASSLILIFSTTFLHILYSFFVENKDRKRLSSFFGQYVPPEIVKKMDHQEAELSLKGENREMTVLFSDVRSFTTLSEGLNPSDLTQFMNEFLTPITAAIHEKKGTIDKYMGDAVMAFWGAPLTDKAHAKHAVQAAFSMIEAMEIISAKFKEQGRPEIKVGIGLNSGQMNVGNMGSKFRMAYTVMGDAVNLGSRLESLTKNYGVSIIVGELTAQLTPEVCYRQLDLVKVKGKNQAVKIFEPIHPSLISKKGFYENLQFYHQALRLYQSKNWDEAEKIFSQLNDESPHLLYNIYLHRIIRNRLFDPGDDWDGSYTFTSK